MSSSDKNISGDLVMTDNEKKFNSAVDKDDETDGNLMNDTDITTEEIKKINEEFVSAARVGNLYLIEQFLSSERSVVDIDCKTGPKQQSAVSAASENGHEDVVRLLVSHHCNIHTRSNIGSTPLLLASWYGHMVVVRVLLAAGADPDVPNKNHHTAITSAFDKGHLEIVDLLISEHSKIESSSKFFHSLMRSVGKFGRKYVGLIPKLVAAGAHVNTASDDGVTPVKTAVFFKNFSVFDQILKYESIISGLDLNEVDSEGQTLMMKCAEDGAEKAVQCFVRGGAEIDKKDVNEMTALMIASERGHEDVVSVLLQAGAQWRYIRNKNGDTARDLSKKNKHQEVDDLLLLYGFTHWGEQSRFKTVLVKAASKAHDGICAKIMDKGISVDATNEAGKTGLQAAAEAGHIGTVSLFLKRGADPSLVSRLGLSALQFSLKFGHLAVATKLLNAKMKPQHHFCFSSAISRVNDFYDYLNSNRFEKTDFGNCDDQLFEKLPLYKNKSSSENDEVDKEKEEDCEIDDDDDDENENNQTSILETVIKVGSEKDKKKCLEVLVLADEKKYGDEQPDKTEQRILEKLRDIFYHPELAETVRYVRSLFPMGAVTFALTSTILFITQIVMGFGSYYLDITTDIDFTLFMFKMKLSNATKVIDNGTHVNINQTLLAVKDTNEFFNAGVISAVHVALSFLISMIFFLCMECGHFSRESLYKIPLPFVTKSYGFFLEYQRLNQRRKKRGLSKDKAIKEWTKKIQSHSDWINLSLMIEASFESAFQFLFQSIFALPVTLGLLNEAEGVDDFLTTQNFSILISFWSFSWTCVSIRYYTGIELGALNLNKLFHMICTGRCKTGYIIGFENIKRYTLCLLYLTIRLSRNLDKKKTHDGKSMLVLMFRIIVDSLSRMAFFSAFMYSKNGCFSSILIMVIYYFVFLIMFLFNLIFNKERPNCSLHYWIGLFINSLTSILTFNSFSFLYLSKDKKRFRPPEGTLVKQMIYFIIFILINIGLTTGTYLHLSNWGADVENINGFSKQSFDNLLILGWTTFVISGALNFGYYKIHPSGVDCTTGNIAGKMTFYVWGSKKIMWKIK